MIWIEYEGHQNSTALKSMDIQRLVLNELKIYLPWFPALVSEITILIIGNTIIHTIMVKGDKS